MIATAPAPRQTSWPLQVAPDRLGGMWTVVRRFTVLAALGLWLGGFALYTAVVIPAAHRHQGGGSFGFVTGEVTAALNLVGAVTIPLLLVNLVADRRSPGAWPRRVAGGTWLLLAVTLVVLYVLHARLDAVLDPKAHRILATRERFDALHERYELFATIQWGAGLIHLGCLLVLWRRTDAAAPDRTA